MKDTIMAPNLTCSLTETPCGSVGYNLRHYLEQINGCDPEMPVIIEHLGSESEYLKAVCCLKNLTESGKSI